MSHNAAQTQPAAPKRAGVPPARTGRVLTPCRSDGPHDRPLRTGPSPTIKTAVGHDSAPGPPPPQPPADRGHGLADARRTARATLRAWRSRLEPTVAGRVWKLLRELDVINSSLQFAAVFTLGFIPFLMVFSVAFGSGLSRAIIFRGGFNAQAAHDVAMLFAHARTSPAGLPVASLVLAVAGGAAISHMLQTWYAKIFRAQIHGWKAMARRAEWLAGVCGYVGLEVVTGRRIQPLSWHIAAAIAQFLLAVAFWWWSLHCLLCGQIPWRRLLPAGLATAVCYTGLGIYIAYVMPASAISNEATFGPIGTVITLLTAEIGLAVALQLGAAIGATIGRGQDPGGPRSGQIRAGGHPATDRPQPAAPTPHEETRHQ